MDIDKISGQRLADKSAVRAINRRLRSGWISLLICMIEHVVLLFPNK